MPVYKRRRKVNPNDANVHIDFVDETGDAFEEYIVFHHKFLTWMKANGYDPDKRYTQEEIDELVTKSPYYKATSNDVDWLMKVKMQGRIQKWVDHSISVTINLPNNVDEDLVNRLYVEAWKSGCKGCTVYRDGSRAGVLISAQKDKKEGKGRRMLVQTASGCRSAPESARSRCGALPEQQREMGCFCGTARRASLRNLHRPAGR